MKTTLTCLIGSMLMLCLAGCHKDEVEPAAPATDDGTHLMFWISSYITNPITVHCNGQDRQLTSYSYVNAPMCGAGGFATFDLPPGTYPFTAEHVNGSWTDTVTVMANTCTKVNLDSVPYFAIPNASIMAGSYTGFASYVPGMISLGSSPDCVIMPYDQYVIQGSAGLDVAYQSDDVATFHYKSNSIDMPDIVFTGVALSRTGDDINFQGGSFNVLSRVFHFDGLTPNSTYPMSDTCMAGFPFEYGANPGGGDYAYWTIENLSYVGVKE